MSQDEKDLDAVVREIMKAEWGVPDPGYSAPPDAWCTAETAARLILKERQERDAAKGELDDARACSETVCACGEAMEPEHGALCADCVRLLTADKGRALAQVGDLAKRLGQCQVERDEARKMLVAKVEKDMGHAFYIDVVRLEDENASLRVEHGEARARIAQIEAEGAANARLRAAFERWQHTIVPRSVEATTRHRMRLADDLRAALAGEEKVT